MWTGQEMDTRKLNQVELNYQSSVYIIIIQHNVSVFV